jgi:transposase InsO family protein
VSSGGVRGVWQHHGLLTKHELLLRLKRETGARQITLSSDHIHHLERVSPEFRERHIEAPHTDALVAVDTFFVGVLMGVGKVHLQTAIDCHSRYGWARLHTSKLPVTAAHLLNNDVLPKFEAHDAKVDAAISANGPEFCGRTDRQPYELFLHLTEVENRTTRVERPKLDGIVERFLRILLDEHLRDEERKTWFETVEEVQASLDAHLLDRNNIRPHGGRGVKGRTPIITFGDGLPR